MNILNGFFIGTTVGLMAFGTTAATINGQYIETPLSTNANTVNLETSADYAVLSEWGISNTGDTKIFGDVGVSPGTAAAVKDFDLKLSFRETFSTSALVMGKIYTAGYNSPTPTKLTRAIMDMLNAYTDASGRAVDVADLSNGNIGGVKFSPGVYKWNSDVTIKNDITLEGDSQSIYIFQIEKNLNVGPNTKVILNGGVRAKNIFWQVAGETTLEENSTFNGIILGQANITLQENAVLNGSALTQSKIYLNANTINISE